MQAVVERNDKLKLYRTSAALQTLLVTVAVGLVYLVIMLNHTAKALQHLPPFRARLQTHRLKTKAHT